MRRLFRHLLSLCLFAALVLSTRQASAQESAQFDFSGMLTATRAIERTFPVDEAPFVFVSNRFGNVVVKSWENPLVHVAVRITAGASTSEDANRTAQAIDIQFDEHDGALNFSTLFPDDGAIAGTGYQIDYEIKAPGASSLAVENIFGDLRVEGVGGGIAVDSQYGNIRLTRIGGPVRVRARGEFKLEATELEHGGHFFLRGTRALLRDVRGDLHVSNYLGSVELRRVEDANATVVSESGPIHFYLNENIATDVYARADFGAVHSHGATTAMRWGKTDFAEFRTDDATSRVELHSTFADTHIISDHLQTQLQRASGPTHHVRDETTQVHELDAGQSLRIDSRVGKVSVHGTADDRVSLRINRSARVRDIAQAKLAIEGLGVQVEDLPDALRVSTLLLEDMEALGCDEYSVNLTVQCPEGAGLRLSAEDGDIHIESMRGRVDAELDQGHMTAENLAGAVRLTNFGGDITVAELAGRTELTAESGAIRARNCSGDLRVEYADGKAVVDTPGSDVLVRGVKGDTRIIALNGIRGDYDVQLEAGSVSLATPDSADATFWLNTDDGEVRSAYSVTGTMENGEYRFQGRLNGGTHRVLLETGRGNIRID